MHKTYEYFHTVLCLGERKDFHSNYCTFHSFILSKTEWRSPFMYQNTFGKKLEIADKTNTNVGGVISKHGTWNCDSETLPTVPTGRLTAVLHLNKLLTSKRALLCGDL